MIEGRAIIKGGSVHVKDLDCTYSKSEVQSMFTRSAKTTAGIYGCEGII